ncbi:MAG: nuclear transport factor 2 family protein [Acidimicrobiales bacterium]
MSRDVAAFAAEWVDAWNAHDLDRILSHYHPDAAVRSPLAAVRVPSSGGVVTGHEALRAYWGPALGPGSEVRFTLEAALRTVDGCTILYRNQRGQLVAETVVWDGDGLVTDAVVSYDERTAGSN